MHPVQCVIGCHRDVDVHVYKYHSVCVHVPPHNLNFFQGRLSFIASASCGEIETEPVVSLCPLSLFLLAVGLLLPLDCHSQPL